MDIESGLIVSHQLSQQPNDRQELEPTLVQLAAQEAALGKVENLLADAMEWTPSNFMRHHNVPNI